MLTVRKKKASRSSEKVRIRVPLDPVLVARADQTARALGISRSELVSMGLRFVLGRRGKQEKRT